MTEDLNTPDELTVLKERATMMNISFHPSIGLEKLREKVNAAMQNQATQEETPMGTAEATVDVAESPAAKRKRMMDSVGHYARPELLSVIADTDAKSNTGSNSNTKSDN